MKRVLIGAISLALAVGGRARGQQPAPVAPEILSLQQCAALASRGQADSAATAGRVAETIYRKRVAANPRDVAALVGAARALSQCILPSADFISQGELSQDAMGYLEDALAIEPTNWTARFVLASIAYRSPAFLNRGELAAKHLDELLRQQGDRAGDPMYARVFEMRGMQLIRSGKGDSAVALWSRGLKVFPADSALAALIARNRVAKPAPEAPIATLPSMRIVATADAAPSETPLPSVRSVSKSQILTTAGGGADIMQAVQTLPGATLVGEGSDVYTRGGDASETATIINGSRVLSLSRFEGLNGGMFGALEPFVVKSVKYSTGGFSARNGNALSGIVEIETDGRPRERKMRAGLSLVQASGTAWLPVNKRLGGWVTGRASQTAALLATHGRTAEFDGAPRSVEMMGSIVSNPTPLAELRATATLATDDSRRIIDAAGHRGPFHSTGATRALMLSSRWMPASAPVVVRGNIIGATRSSDWRFGVLSRNRHDRNVLGRVDAEWQASEPLLLRAGIENGAADRLDRGTVPTSPSAAIGAPMRELTDGRAAATQHGGYSEAEMTAGSSVVVLGVRADRLPGETAVTVDPRIELSTRRGEWTARMSGGVFHQGRWRPDAAIPDAGTPSGTPGEARHLVVGLENESGYGTLRVEAFAKSYGDYTTFGAGPQIASTEARGLDLLAQRPATGKLSGWLGYSLLDAESRLRDGRRVRSTFDVTHSLTGSLTARVTDDWSIGSTARYGTGRPATPIIGATGVAGQMMPAYGTLKGERLPGYARLDARVMRFIRRDGYLATTFVELINLTNRHNVSGFAYDAGYRNRQPMHSFFASRTVVVGGEFQFR